MRRGHKRSLLVLLVILGLVSVVIAQPFDKEDHDNRAWAQDKESKFTDAFNNKFFTFLRNFFGGGITGLQVGNLPPTATSAVVDSPSGSGAALNTAGTNEDLTASLVGLSDPDFDAVTNITNWIAGATSLALLNMPFEAHAASATVAKDYATLGDGTVSGGVTFVPGGGVDGFGAYQFSGVSGQHISIPNVLVDNSYTLSAWVKPNPGAATKTIIDLSDNANVCYLRISEVTPNAASFACTGGLAAVDTVDLADGAWHHIAGVRSGGVATLYVDGVPVATDTSFTTPTFTATQSQIGEESFASQQFFPFDGLIDQVSIYSGSLPAGQIAVLAQGREDVIDSSLTSVGGTWSAQVTPNDGTVDGATLTSNNVLITTNALPSVSQVILDSTDGSGALNNDADPTEDLDVSFVGENDEDGDGVKTIEDWQVDGVSLAVLNLPFEGHPNSAGSALDYSGFANNGVVGGATFFAAGGEDGFGAYDFNGNVFVQVADNPSLDFGAAQSFTLTARFRADTLPASRASIVVKRDGFNAGYEFDLVTSGGATRIGGLLEDTLGTAKVSDQTGTAVLANVWYQGVLVVDRSANTMTHYLNGQLSETTDISTITGPLAHARPLYVGADQENARFYFDGKIDDVHVYNRVLSPEQVQSLFVQGNDVLVSQETVDGESWQVCATPNDGNENGIEKCSNTVNIDSGVCPNNIREGSEVCDGIDLAGQSCFSQGFTSGTLACAGTCDAFDTSACVSVCGNSLVETGEQCDGGACCSATCQFESAAVQCRASAGVCDVAEQCSGTFAACPTDAFQPLSTVCPLTPPNEANHCDGLGACVCNPTEATELSCADGFDNDCDGLVDLTDGNCQINFPPTADSSVVDTPSGSGALNNKAADGEDLTASLVNLSDVNGDLIRNITNWFLNGASFPVLNLPFENHASAATLAKDYALGNDGVVTSATFNSVGGSDGFGFYDFDGVDDRIFVGGSNSFNLGSFTFSSWVKGTSLSGIILQRFQCGGSPSIPDCSIGPSGSQNDVLGFTANSFSLRDAAATSQAVSCDINLVNDDQWHLVTGVRDISAGQMTMYVDGVQCNSAAATTLATIQFDSDIPFTVGVSFAGFNVGNELSGFFDGSLDDLRIYNSALSAGQVASLFNQGSSVIAAAQTNIGQTWSAQVTPNDGTLDGPTLTSNSVVITAPGTCSNGLAEGGETCDGADVVGQTCITQGFASGPLACSASCDAFDTSACVPLSVCGDNVQEGFELCDGPDLGGESCFSQGFTTGSLVCVGSCDGFDTAACVSVCGNSLVESGEVCDSANLNAQTCETQGFASGTLACSGTCDVFDTNACVPAVCGNTIVETGEACDDGNLISGDGCSATCELEALQKAGATFQVDTPATLNSLVFNPTSNRYAAGLLGSVKVRVMEANGNLLTPVTISVRTSEQTNIAPVTTGSLAGGFSAIWDERNQPVGVTNPHDLLNHRLSSTGSLVFVQLQVTNTLDNINQRKPSLAYKPSTNKLLSVWTEADSKISARLFASDDAPLNVPQFDISTPGGSLDDKARVAYDSTLNEWLVVWSRKTGSTFQVIGQRVGTGGSLLGSPIAISSTGTQEPLPDVAALDSGTGWAVVWQDPRNTGIDIFGRLVGASGVLGPEVGIGDLAGADDVEPTVASLSNTVLVSWSRNTATDNLAARLFDDTLSALSKVEGVPDVDSLNQRTPRSAANAGATEYMVAWNELTTVFAQRIGVNLAVPLTDTDADGVIDSADECTGTLAAAAVDNHGCSDAQVDGDGDGACDPGALGRGPSACTVQDNCPVLSNPSQSDIDGDGLGDVCDSQTCGLNGKEGTEVCDGLDLGGQTCPGLGFPGGDLACSPSCTSFDTSSCTSICGDGLIGSGEQCDDNNALGGDGCSAVCELEQDFLIKWQSSFDFPRGIDVDSLGNVYVVDEALNKIKKFDSEGNFLLEWGTAGSGAGQFNFPSDVAVDGQDNLYIVERGGARVQKFDSSGNFLLTWGSTGTGSGQFNSPRGISLDSSGNVYVADSSNHRIQKFDSTGGFITLWGAFGTSAGLFNNPYSVEVDNLDRVYVVERNNHRVQRFTTGGTHQLTFGSVGTANGQFSSPEAIGVDDFGDVYVVDTNNHRIQKFDSTGSFKSTFGSLGSLDGQLSTPRGITIDSIAQVYVVDSGNKRVQLFSAEGKLDGDVDGFANFFDNCPIDSNPTQSDIDSDTFGEPCDVQTCGDGTTQAPGSGDGFSFDESCDGEVCCTASCTLVSLGVECRAAADVCDVAEQCTGTLATCPVNAFVPLDPATVCLPTVPPHEQTRCDGSGVCNACNPTEATELSCGDGLDNDCDGFVDNTDQDCDIDGDGVFGTSDLCENTAAGEAVDATGCSCNDPGHVSCDDSNLCTVDSCNILSGLCENPAGNIGVECRASGGVCDIAEQCDGITPSCPADTLKSTGTECRVSTDLCDAAEQCTGSSVDCPVDVLEISGTVCRGAADACDVGEQCDGLIASCPVDAFQPLSTVCPLIAPNPDNHCDGFGACVCNPTEATELSCSDGLDNDCDSLVDLNDDDCGGDADGDTIINAEDLCPGTGISVLVDLHGCSEAQVDPDGDLICSPDSPSVFGG